MTFVSLSFLFFILICTILYFAVPKKIRWIILLAGSMVFYLISSGALLLFLILAAAVTFFAGIRIETILEVAEHTENEWGRFLSFEPLTLVPFDRNLIDVRYLTPETKDLLNEYHFKVRTALSPMMSGEELDWLYEQTEPV